MGVKLTELGNDGITYRKNIYKIGKFMVHRLIKPWLYSDIAYTLFGYQKEFQRLLKSVHGFTQMIIDKRRIDFNFKADQSKKGMSLRDENDNIYMGTRKKRFAMMDTLLQAQSEGQIDDEGIIEETDTFTFEGHDTTSAGMTFTLLLLAHNPEVQEKLFEEIQDVTYGKEDLTVDDFGKMNYMERVLKESLRIYPPVPFISRSLSKNVTIGKPVNQKNYGRSLILFLFR
jgi:cytochrome P450 family 4